MKPPSLTWVIKTLTAALGPAAPPFPVDPFEQVLWENVAYLANDERRREAFESLRDIVGTRPEQVLEASPEQLVAVARRGILSEATADKLRTAAEIALSEFHGDLAEVLRRPVPKAKRALRRFPSIGEPGAEKILCATRTAPFLAVESNGLRVLVRLGLCPAGKAYAATYAAARQLGQQQLGDDFDALLVAREQLRQLGRTVCRNTRPQCGSCALRPRCPTGQGAGG